MYKAVFKIEKMDCHGEENLIRLKLENTKAQYVKLEQLNILS